MTTPSQKKRGQPRVDAAPVTLSADAGGGQIDADRKAGRNLRAWREHRGMTQADLASAVYTTAPVISLLESGARQLSVKWLNRLALALHTTPGQLLDHAPDTTILDSERNILIGMARAASRMVEAFGAVEAAADILESKKITSPQDLQALGVPDYDICVLGEALERARQLRRQTIDDLRSADAEYKDNPASYR